LIPAVITQIPFIESAQARVTADMESMVLTGLTTLVCSWAPFLLLNLTSASVMQNQTLLASSLQTAFNLGVLPSLVQNLVTNICRETEEQIRGAFDLMKVSKSNSEVFFIHCYSNSNISFLSAVGSPIGGTSQTTYKSRIRVEPNNTTAPQWAVSLWQQLATMMEELSQRCIKASTGLYCCSIPSDAPTRFIHSRMC
jgi:conserved oligomeric Golgi complex subunit 5